MELSLSTRTVAGHRVLEVGGEIDVYTAPQLRERLISLVEAGDGLFAVRTDLGVDVITDRPAEARELLLGAGAQPVSLDAPPPGKDQASELGSALGARDPEMESLPDRLTLASLLIRVPERERRILHLRFSGNMTQAEIAAECGISQMHVSRLLTQTLAWLRQAMAVSGGSDDE